MQSVENYQVDGVVGKLFNDPFMINPDPIEAQKQWDFEMERVSGSNGHIEVFAGTPENIEDRSMLSRQSRRRLERLEKKLNKKIAKQNS